MALLFMDGFDQYGTADLLKRWNGADGSASIGDTTGRRGSRGLYLGNLYGAGLNAVLPSTDTTFVIGFAVKFTSIDFQFGLFNSSWACVSGVNLVGAGSLAYLRAGGGGGVVADGVSLGQSIPGIVSAGTWYYLEWKVKLHSSLGTAELRVNGVTVVSATGVNTLGTVVANVTPTLVYFRIYSAHIDDVYFLDSTGSTNNDFLGDVRVDVHRPTADGVQGWTPSTGVSHYALVDETTPNTTDYNSTNTLNAVDTFVMEDLKNSGARIVAVATNMYHSKEDAGACLVAPVTRISSTNYVGLDYAPSASSYNYAQQFKEVNPATGLAWSESTFNATEFGYKKTG